MSEPVRSDAARDALLDQLSHLADEIEAFAGQLNAVPAEVVGTRPVEGELSLKEIYALLAACDRYVYLPAVEQLERGEAVVVEARTDDSLLEEEPVHGNTMEYVLERARSGRIALVEHLEKVRDWDRGLRIGGEMRRVYDLAYTIIQHDTALLRKAAVRLHELGRLDQGLR